MVLPAPSSFIIAYKMWIMLAVTFKESLSMLSIDFFYNILSPGFGENLAFSSYLDNFHCCLEV